LKSEWKTVSVDLSVLTEKIVEFFSSRDFTVLVDKSEKGFRCTIIPKIHHKILDKITVNVCKTAENLTVEFTAENLSHSLVRYGNLLSLFGGGVIFLKGLKSKEELEKLEEDFWWYVDQLINHLQVTSRLSSKTSPNSS